MVNGTASNNDKSHTYYYYFCNCKSVLNKLVCLDAKVFVIVIMMLSHFVKLGPIVSMQTPYSINKVIHCSEMIGSSAIMVV